MANSWLDLDNLDAMDDPENIYSLEEIASAIAEEREALGIETHEEAVIAAAMVLEPSQYLLFPGWAKVAA